MSSDFFFRFSFGVDSFGVPSLVVARKKLTAAGRKLTARLEATIPSRGPAGSAAGDDERKEGARLSLLPKSKKEVEIGNPSFSTTAARTAAVRRSQALPSSSGRPCFFLLQESQLLLPRARRVSSWYSSAPSRSCRRPSDAQSPSSSSVLKYLSLVDTLIHSGSVDVIFVDSVAALVPKGELDGEMGDAHMAMQARLMSQALRKLSHSLSVSQCILIFINQVRSKLSTFGGFGWPQEVTCGGNALKFYASVRLNIRRIGFVKKVEEILGSQVLVKVVKNKLAPPFKTAEFELQFGKGINRECEIIDLSVKHKIILKAGAIYYFNDKNFCGRDAFKSFLAENHSAFEELQMKLRQKLLDDTEVEKEQDSDVTSDVKEEITTTLESTDEESSAAVEA
ncbi:DNA repair protein recA homolog 3, mitochondrial-like [Arachis stenosperma]|uniref:DNA repair protein recA homolog 3, mitochondrial-like n=1 Tax=Arachis stenosperma TaxID=217475 RepID=UPI0025ABDC0B|nr:DNA repair protein recA homolog 3, mitochondrial-like [Arachis stenosperma]